MAAIAIMSAFTLAAQSGTVSATLQDGETGEPVGFATMTLFKKGATKPSKYGLSDSKGLVSIDKVAAGTYTVKVEMLGYNNWSKDYTVSGNLNIGKIELSPDKETLKAASVSAVGNQMTIKKDTIEYNAAAFKTTDNDMLEDLLKKLPGVEVSSDGAVTVNGETVSKITIDGKTFFLDDPQIATKNIPAKLIKKLKVMEKKSEQAEFTGIDDGERETVIDLSVQPGMMKGLFGNVMGGVGHDLLEKADRDALGDNGDTRYQGAAFIGNFTDKRQLSLILNANNTNNRGFDDIARTAMSGMRGSGRGRGGSSEGNGITTSYMAGVNGAWTLFDNKMDFGGNYLFNGSENDVKEESAKTTYQNGYNLLYNTSGTSSSDAYGHRFGFRMDHKFSDKTSLLFSPSFNIGTGKFSEFSDFTTKVDSLDGTITKLNDGFNFNSGDSKNVSADGFLLFRQRLGIPGRTISFMGRYNVSHKELDGFNQSRTLEYDETGTNVQDSIVNQRYDNTINSALFSGRLTYTEPIGNGFYVEGNYGFTWSRNTSEKYTYDNADNTGFSADNLFFVRNGEILNATYSNDILNRYISQRAGANIMYQKDKLRAQVGIGITNTKTHNETNGETYDSNVYKFSPSAMLFYDLNDNTNARLFYRGSSSQPSTSQLMPVADNSDPLDISFGNPYLKPYFEHSLRGDARFTNKKTFTTFSLRLSGSYTQDPIVSALWYGTNGTQYTMPFNGPDKASFNVRTFFNSPIKKSNFSVFNMLFASYSQSASYVGTGIDTDKYYQNGEFDYETFNSDYTASNSTLAAKFRENRTRTGSFTERLRLTYRNDFIELQAGGRTRFNKSWYTIASTTTTATWNNQINGSLNYTWKSTGIGFDTQLEYNWYEGYSTAQEDEYVWNAQITKLILKNKVTLAVRAYDILNQARNLTVTDNSNYHKESVNNTLGRYIIASVTWRFGQNKHKGRRGFGGPGGYGRGGGPMGPPGR